MLRWYFDVPNCIDSGNSNGMVDYSKAPHEMTEAEATLLMLEEKQAEIGLRRKELALERDEIREELQDINDEIEELEIQAWELFKEYQRVYRIREDELYGNDK